MINHEQTIISQYASSPTITALLASINDAIDPQNDIANLYNTVLNVDTAVGFGLDIIGRIVGINRQIDVPIGTPNPGGLPATFGVYTLLDTEYRNVILLKAMTNITGGNSLVINRLLTAFYAPRGRAYVLDLGNMAMQYVFEFWIYPYEYVIIMQGLAPRPAGVQASILQIDVTQTFGFEEAGNLQPFDQGVFYV